MRYEIVAYFSSTISSTAVDFWEWPSWVQFYSFAKGQLFPETIC